MAAVPLLPRTAKAGGRPRYSPLQRRRAITGLLAISPAMAFVFVFFFVPLALAVWMSLTSWNVAGFQKFVGLDNYAQILKDQTFIHALLFTAAYALVTTLLTFLIGLALALLVQSRLRRYVALRTMFYLPVVIGMATASFIYVWLFNDQIGPVDGLLNALRLTSTNISWLGEVGTAFFVLILLTVWKLAGFAMIILLIGIQTVPRELYEAAEVDGATKLRQLRSITIPLIRSSIALVFVLLFVNAALAFDQFYIITRGRPGNSTITAVYWVFNQAFVGLRFGYSAALAIVLLFLLVIVSSVQLRLLHSDATEA